jgi:hypothetical protein
VGASISGGYEAYQQYQEGDFDASELAGKTAKGAVIGGGSAFGVIGTVGAGTLAEGAEAIIQGKTLEASALDALGGAASALAGRGLGKVGSDALQALAKTSAGQQALRKIAGAKSLEAGLKKLSEKGRAALKQAGSQIAGKGGQPAGLSVEGVAGAVVLTIENPDRLDYEGASNPAY